MVNPDWGIKRTCHSCGAKYYDFKKKAPECPSCNTLFDPEALLKSRRRAMETEDEVEETESDEVLENTDDLGGDDVEVEAEKEEEEEK